MPGDSARGGLSRLARSRWVQASAWCVGVGLVVAAIVVAWGGGPGMGAMVERAMARPWLVAALIALPMLNWVLTTGIFWVLLLPTDRASPRVPMRDMGLLIALAGLLNYLPLKPGLVGRVAFHRVHHGVAVGRTVQSVVAALIIGAACVGVMLAASAARVAWVVPTLAGVLGVLAAIAWRRGGLVMRGDGRFLAAGSLRCLDLCVWIARYHVAGLIVGVPLSVTQASAMAAIGQAAMLVPIFGNGLGLREWAIGLAGPALGEATRGEALSIDLVNRAAEVVVVTVLGVLAGWMLRGPMRAIVRGATRSVREAHAKGAP